MQFIRNAIRNMGIVGEIFSFLWRNKRWWLIPMVAVLLVFGFALMFATSSGLGPLIYTLF
jgi:hypothetical protein